MKHLELVLSYWPLLLLLPVLVAAGLLVALILHIPVGDE